MKYYIYALMDPITKRIRYIGKTNNLKRRIKDHIKDCDKIGFWTPKNKWLMQLKANNLKPIIKPLLETTKEKSNEDEIRYIAKYKKILPDLTNDTDGGDGYDWTGRKHEEESVKRMKYNHPFRKVILQFDMNNKFIQKFESSKELDEHPIFDRSHATKCCKGKYKQHQGYYFRYSDNYFPCELAQPLTDKDMVIINKILEENQVIKLPTKRKKATIDKNNKIKEEKLKNRKPKKIYIHYDLNGNILGRYIGIAEASRQSGVHVHLIEGCCKNKSYYTANNSTFRYEGDEFDYTPYNKYVQVGSKKVFKYNLEGVIIEEYDSIKRAAHANNVFEANISRCCKNKYNRKNGKNLIVGGFTYRFENDDF